MNTPTINIILFTVFAFSLSVWAMQHNGRDAASVSSCYGECYKEYEESNGGVVAIAQAQAAAKAEALTLFQIGLFIVYFKFGNLKRLRILFLVLPN